MGLGIGHFIPVVVYLGCWVACILSLTGRPIIGLYYIIPLLPYRTMRDHFLDYPLGANVLTILIIAVLIGALIHGKRLPPSKLYSIWLIFGVYLYISMWIGTLLGNAPAPLWLSDINFSTWKDYMLMPLILVASALVIEDRKDIRRILIIAAISLALIDRSSLLDSLSRSWGHFDENKRDAGPLGFAGVNGTAAFLAQFAVFFWGVARCIPKKKYKLLGYGLTAATLLAMMYEFSRGAYIAVILSIFVLGLLKDRKLILVLAVFLLTWQAIVPTAVQERVNMTHNSNGKLEASAQERVELWQNAKETFFSSPIFGTGYATFQLTKHFDNLRDTHNWYVKVLLETGVIGMIIALLLLARMLALSYGLFRTASDPLYQGLGMGLLLAICSCIVSNMFGDRWTYIEVNGLLWVLVAAAIRAQQLSAPIIDETEIKNSRTRVAYPRANQKASLSFSNSVPKP